MSQYLNVKSCMCAIITLETPAKIFVTKITLVLLISRRQLNGRQRGTQEMAAVRKWLL